MQAERAKKEAQTLGRSSGGFCTKLHLFLDNQERLLGIELSGDQESDHKYASALVFEAIEHKSRSIVDDKGYDSLALRKMIGEAGMKCVIPYRKWKDLQRPEMDKTAYKLRNVIERFIGKIKENRRVATRYDKKASHFKAFIILAALNNMAKCYLLAETSQ